MEYTCEFDARGISMPLSDDKMDELFFFRPLQPLTPLGFFAFKYSSSLESLWREEIQNIIWASTRENLSLGFANNKGADQPSHSRGLISLFVICFLERI